MIYIVLIIYGVGIIFIIYLCLYLDKKIEKIKLLFNLKEFEKELREKIDEELKNDMERIHN